MYMEEAIRRIPDVDPSTVSTTVVARAGAIPLRSDVSPAATAAGAADAQGVVVARGAHSATAVQVVDSRDASPRMSVPSASATCHCHTCTCFLSSTIARSLAYRSSRGYY